MANVSVFRKLFLFLLVLTCFLAHFTVFRAVNRNNRLKHTGKWVKRYCRLALRILGVSVNIRENKNTPPDLKFHGPYFPGKRCSALKKRTPFRRCFEGKISERGSYEERERAKETPSGFQTGHCSENHLFAVNHSSYLDALILYSVLKDPRFITSADIIFFLGMITKLSNCQAVGGRRQKRLLQDIRKVKNLLISGQNVVLFPEATIGAGEKLLNFKSPFLHSAVQAKKEIQPVCLNYLSIDGQPLNQKNKDKVFWHGGCSFFRHFFRLCRVKKITAEIIFTPSLKTEGVHRRDLTETARAQIERKWISPMN